MRWRVFVPSRGRPLQLDGLLRSFRHHCGDGDLAEITVLVRPTTPEDRRGYAVVASENPEVRFYEERSFCADARRLLGSTGRLRLVGVAKGIARLEDDLQMLAVDDTIFVRPFSLAQIASALRSDPRALGFSLRLGESIRYCQPLDIPSAPPPLCLVKGGEHRDDAVVSATWVGRDPDWGYPLELSSSIYRRRELAAMVRRVSFDSPTTLEDGLWRVAPVLASSHPDLLCFQRPRAFAAAVNRVQDIAPNPTSGHQRHEPGRLTELFLEGWRLDVAAYEGFVPHACHEGVELLLTRGGPSGRA